MVPVYSPTDFYYIYKKAPSMESKLTLQGLYDKRDGLRVRIRKEHHNKLLRHRRWMLLNPDSEGQLLIKIDCNEIVHFLQSTPL